MRKENNIQAKIFKQKSTLLQSIVFLKQMEVNRHEKCRSSCNIDHEKFNWIKPKFSKISEILRKIESISDFSEDINSDKSIYLCDICGKYFKTNSSFKTHVNNDHIHNSNSILSEVCEQSDKGNPNNDIKHLYRCDICDD